MFSTVILVHLDPIKLLPLPQVNDELAADVVSRAVDLLRLLKLNEKILQSDHVMGWRVRLGMLEEEDTALC